MGPRSMGDVPPDGDNRFSRKRQAKMDKKKEAVLIATKVESVIAAAVNMKGARMTPWAA